MSQKPTESPSFDQIVKGNVSIKKSKSSKDRYTSVTSSAFEDVDKITKKMFEKITKTSIMPEFECSPCFVKPGFCATCTRQHVFGIVAIQHPIQHPQT
jgi:hypothetical protein